MLCDEPTGALDSKTGVLVLEALSATNRELGTTTAIITHNASIGGLADRIFYFLDGRISRIETNEQRLKPSEITW
jgi:putative ABC transport system ATP-binding protein